MFETPFMPEPLATESGDKTPSTPSSGAMPTAEAVWARVHAAVVTRSAIYAGLAVSVCCDQLPSLKNMSNPDVGRPIPSPPRRQCDDRVRNIVLTVTGVCAALSLIALVVLAPRQMRRARPESTDRDASEPLAPADAENADAER
jgi:hypothetical protein